MIELLERKGLLEVDMFPLNLARYLIIFSFKSFNVMFKK